MVNFNEEGKLCCERYELIAEMLFYFYFYMISPYGKFTCLSHADELVALELIHASSFI